MDPRVAPTQVILLFGIKQGVQQHSNIIAAIENQQSTNIQQNQSHIFQITTLANSTNGIQKYRSTATQHMANQQAKHKNKPNSLGGVRSGIWQLQLKDNEGANGQEKQEEKMQSQHSANQAKKSRDKPAPSTLRKKVDRILHHHVFIFIYFFKNNIIYI